MLTSRSDHGTKVAIIQNNRDKYSVSAMCDVLQITRSTFYYEAKEQTNEDDVTEANSSEFKTMKSDYEKLKIANDELNKKVSLQMKELDELKNGPGKMIALAQEQYNARKYTDAKKTIQDLTTKYPSSPEVAKSKELLILIESDQVKQKEEDKQRIALATSKMKAEVDEVENITWYTDISTKTSGSSVHAYVGKPEKGKLQLRMVFRFEGLSWLYVQSYKIKTDDKTFDFSVDYNNVKRTNPL